MQDKTNDPEYQAMTKRLEVVLGSLADMGVPRTAIKVSIASCVPGSDAVGVTLIIDKQYRTTEVEAYLAAVNQQPS